MYPQDLPPSLISRDLQRPAGDWRNRTRPFGHKSQKDEQLYFLFAHDELKTLLSIQA